MNDRAPDNYLVYDFVRATALPGLLWFRPRRLYADQEARKRIRGGAIVIANHMGHFDPVYLMMAIWYRRHHFVCTKEFFEGRFSSWLFSRFHCIPIDRDNFSMESLRRITDELRAGRLVSLFPEGRITASSDVAPFKSGMVLMAMKSETPIVPVYICPRKHWYSRLTVCIGRPLDVIAEMGGRPSLTKMNEVAALLEEKERELIALAEQAGR